MTGRSAKSESYAYYKCSNSHKKGRCICGSNALPKDKIEKLVIEVLKARVLTDNNLEKLVDLVNKELKDQTLSIKDRFNVVDTELIEIESKLGKLYEAIETEKLSLDDIAPRLKMCRARQKELQGICMNLEVSTIAIKAEK